MAVVWLNLDKYRRQARNLAWYDHDGEPSTHNPFKKFRRQRPRRTDSIQLESKLTPIRTAGDVRLDEERRRRKDMTDGLVGPEHSDSFPPESSGTDQVTPDRAGREPSMHSNEPINISAQTGLDEDQLGGPRKRRTFASGFGDKSLDGDTDSNSAKDVNEKPKFTAMGQLKATLFNSWVNILLLAAPAGIALNYVDVDPVAVFVVNFIAIMSSSCSDVGLRDRRDCHAHWRNNRWPTQRKFGNAVELIVAIIALVDNEVTIVQTSLIGSMLSNLLLVMGMCFLFGGVNRLEQHFNPVVAQTAASLLALAVGCLIIPTAFHNWSGAGNSGVAELSRGTSIIMLVVYGCYLFFQLGSHAEMYNSPSPKVEKRRGKVNDGDTHRGIAQIGKMTATLAGQNAQQLKLQDPDEEEEEPQLSIWVAVLTLAISTALVALCAEYMVDSINAITDRGGVSKTFVGLILLPIVGNAAEHATAVTVACKDKMDLAIGVAVGSSMQIALLVLPLIIVIGWGMGNNDMTLYFDAFQVILLFVAVLLVNYLIADGKSHWLEGVLLMMMYLIIAVAAWFYPTKTEEQMKA
ncbi:sodium/calcium transporter [Aspergillus bombycis]|uniref:Sodium/calcium transporter n=1 Tax=Aspergillus bombycis TaxID=109264 RepID=A0A1F8A3P9_9EURO|nr:sodium/calcium transporter [Aspergillus bombycis]OGM46313.1 sodium/calcium transporter [Aspergillus bombycis]